jgi:hypothetical protein
MSDRPRARLAALAVAACAALAPSLAAATLGERVESVEADRTRLSARLAGTTDLGRYRVYTLDSPVSMVRQFARPDGVIFAVAWSGLAVPDLTPLLGAYAADYRAARPLQRPRRGARSARVTGQQVVVETWGRMRDLHGLAYLPALLPAGVEPDAMR